MQEKFNQIKSTWALLSVAIYTTEITFRLGLVLVWNWIISPEFNRILFGSNELGLWKGLVIVSIAQYFLVPRQYFVDYITNNQLFKKWGE